MTIAPTPETSPVTPQHHRRHDDTPPEGSPLTPREETIDAAVDRETQSTLLREVIDMRRRGFLAHDETHAKIDACISDVRALNARLDDVQTKQGDHTKAMKNLADNVASMSESLGTAMRLQTDAILKLERRVAQNEEDADGTKAAVAVALGGEAKARQKLESYGEITEKHLRAELLEQRQAIADTRSFLDKHFGARRARWTAALVSGAGVVKVVYDIWEKLK